MPNNEAQTQIAPAEVIGRVTTYAPSKAGAPVDLRLDGNEGKAPPAKLLEDLSKVSPEALKRYTRPDAFEATIAQKFGLKPDQVMVTAGADDAIDRICRALLTPEKEIIVPIPTFEMLPRYAALTGAQIVEVDWSKGAYPREDVLKALTSKTSIITVITPNNPTGAVATVDDVKALSAAAPQALIMVDMVYAECADDDFTQAVLALPNAIVLRSFSKAWGLAGLRVGYVLGPASILSWLRVASGPYMLSSLSLLIAERWMFEGQQHVTEYVERIRYERKALADKLFELGAQPQPSQANFVLARFENATWVRDALAGLGIGVRLFTGRPELENCTRITCPADEHDFDRLLRALETVLKPQALVLSFENVVAALDTKGQWEPFASKATLQELGRLYPLALLTFRTREDAVQLLTELELNELFPTVLSFAECGSENIIQEASKRLSASNTWVLTIDPGQVEAARQTQALPLGVLPDIETNEKKDSLIACGAARVLQSLDQLKELLP